MDEKEFEELKKLIDKNVLNPKGLIYVINKVPAIPKMNPDIKKFESWMKILSSKYNEKIPLLFLVNIIDKRSNYDLRLITEMYHIDKYGFPYHIAPISAKTGENLDITFKWLLKKSKINYQIVH